MPEPFTQMLTELVRKVDGALGAAFIDNYGEAVQTFASEGDDEEIRLMGAYQGIALQTSRGILSQLQAGKIDYFYTSYDKVSFLVKALQQEYFLMMVLGPDANVGQGIYYLRQISDEFDREI